MNELISIHANRLNNRYNRLMNYYFCWVSIIRKLAKAKGKPDNRLVINFAKELVDNEVGFFAGTPVKFDYDDNGQENQELDQRIADFVAINDLTDSIVELAKQVDIFIDHIHCFIRMKIATPEWHQSTHVMPLYQHAVYYTQRQRNGAISGTLHETFSSTFHGSASAGIQYDEVTDNLFTMYRWLSSLLQSNVKDYSSK